MAKQKTSFYCQNCGADSPKWVGKCPSCGEWNTYIEEVVIKDSMINQPSLWKRADGSGKKAAPQKIQEVKSEKLDRLTSGNNELNRVLGGGIVPGSLVLLGGEPGIGKSTLLLQIAIQIQQLKVLYVSGEESPQQIKMRADRIGVQGEACFLLAETSLNDIFDQIAGLSPDLVVIDSIQTVHSPLLDAAPGSISQVKECTGQLMRYAKESGVPVFLIGHINKEGSIAGPKVLEHMVDTVLQFEGDRNHFYRILRTTKNRFGSTDELGIYQMNEAGLREVSNPSEVLLSEETSERPGVAIGATLEGNRPLLIEVQALVSPATYGTPQRSSTGFDVKRLHMLLAVLEKRLGLKLGTQDVFLNITGGIRISDPSLDLAVCAAVFSSYHDVIISTDTCFVGEVGLGGEIRKVSRSETRIKEADKLGFKSLIIAGKPEKGKTKIAVQIVDSLRSAFQEMFG
ncbi:MAG: DNA repair protein RadA [Cyclobacteriaceae bacterium]